MQPLIHLYLVELREALNVRPERTERILCEIEDHLCESAMRETRRGFTPEEAVKRAIRKLGTPREIAEAFDNESETD
jgi:hypothetical protein